MNRYNKRIGRGKEEWANFWYDQSNKEQNKRVLIIGDSTGRQIRGKLSKRMQCPVDFFGTSSDLRDCLFWNQIECFFKDSLYRYDAILLWIGVHAKNAENGHGYYEESDYVQFKDNFIELITYLRQKQKNLLVMDVFDSVKPRFSKNISIFLSKIGVHFKCKIEPQREVLTRRKNEIIRFCCEHTDTKFVSINSIMSKTKYNRVDEIHYSRESDSFVCDIIKQNLDAI